jgi:hypothetical protein
MYVEEDDAVACFSSMTISNCYYIIYIFMNKVDYFCAPSLPDIKNLNFSSSVAVKD